MNMEYQAIVKHIEHIAQAAGLKVKFFAGRRSTDIVMVTFSGERAQVLASITALVNSLDTVDLELIVSDLRHLHYTLTLAITTLVDEQQLQQPERRAKLKRFLQDELQDNVRDALQDNVQDSP